MATDKPYIMCPLCRGDGSVSLEVIEAFKLGKAIGALTGPDFEKFAANLGAIIGDQVADVLAEYQVALVRQDR